MKKHRKMKNTEVEQIRKSDVKPEKKKKVKLPKHPGDTFNL
jgi:hypothetical protein